MGRAHRRRILAIVGSLGLHALALLWLRALPPAAARPAEPAPRGIDLELVSRAPPRTSLPTPAQAVPGAVSRPARRRVSAASATKAVTEAETRATPPSDVPRALDLAAPLAASASGIGSAPDTTERNVAGLRSDRRRPDTQATIQSWIDEDTAVRRVENGLVDDWFGHLGQALGDALDKKPPPLSVLSKGMLPEALASMGRRYAAALDRYSRTGSPGAEWVTPGVTTPDPGQGVAMALGDLRASQVLDGRRLAPLLSGETEGGDLWAIVEVRMGFGGVLEGSSVLESSGNRPFNRHVLDVVVAGLPGLPDLPDGGFGIHADGARSVWQVAGHLTFERDMRKLSLEDDAWYLPLAAAGGLLNGHFDETTGYVGYLDLRHPRLHCTVKLLKVN